MGDQTLAGTATNGNAGKSACVPDRVDVIVEYRLAEYKQVLRDFIPVYLRTTKKQPNRLLPWNWPVMERLMFAIVVPVIFALKKRRIGTCAFTFTETGLARTSRGRTAERAWSDVRAVHHLSAAYLIELKAGGAMPLPFRIFSQEQRRIFDKFSRQVG